MTGFGRAQRRGRLGTVTVEIKSVNHRFLEVSCRMPEGGAALEDPVRALVQGALHRGKVTVSVTTTGAPAPETTVNLAAARRHLAALRRLQRVLKIPGAVTLEHLATWPGVLVTSAPNAILAWRPVVLAAVREALRACVRARQREGRALTIVLRRLARRLERATDLLAARAPQVVEAYRARLKARVRALTTHPVDPGRLEQEVAFFAKECDVAEELTRIRAHVAQAHAVAARTAPAGRTLDFVAQELQREINTIGSKAGDVEVARLAIQMKGWVEQLREQVQNLE